MSPYSTNPLAFRTLVRTSVIIIGFVILGAYITWQARFLIMGPQVILTSEPARVTNERIITLAGEVRNIAKITLNGRQIFTDPSGHFNEALVLENGYTIATIAATDRYGRTTNVTRSFMYTPASFSAATSSVTNDSQNDNTTL